MRYLIFLIASILSITPVIARDYSYEIRQAQRSCRIKIDMRLDSRASCQKVQDLIALQRIETQAEIALKRLEVEAEVARQTSQPMPDHTTVTIDNSSHSTLINASPRLIVSPVTNAWCWSYSGVQCY